MTKILKINPNNPEPSKIKIAAELIKKGKIISFPTDTLYGLACNALNPKVVQKIQEIKNRSKNKPLSINIANKKDLWKYIDISAEQSEAPIRKLIKKFWPGQLTIIFKKSDLIPNIVTAKENTIGIRIPNNKIALELIRQSGVPIISTSANPSGKPPPTTAQEVKNYFDNISPQGGAIDLIIDGGKCLGIPSTIIDMTKSKPKLIRKGVISFEEIKNILN